MRIRQTPCFSLKDVIKRGKKDIDIYPLNSKNCYLFYGARYAIWAGIKVLGITPGHNILMPSYNCGTEIDPILDQEVQVKYYNIKKNMAIDTEDLVKQIDSNTTAIFVIHYMGFPQPLDEIKKMCNTYGLFLIEDCAHAFLGAHNSRNLGTYGDISVFSIRKTLPIPNGGALVINNNNFKFEENMIKGSALSTYFVAIELLKNRTQQGQPRLLRMLIDMVIVSMAFMNKVFMLMLRVFKKISSYKGLALIHINYYCREFKRELAKWRISAFSERIMYNINYEKIKQKRRKNFEYLLMNLPKNQDIEVVFNRLPEGVCPLFFPIIVKDRQYYYRKFSDRGITTFQYWQHMHDAVSWDKFPDAVFLKQHVLGLPVHQDISFDHLKRIIEVFNDINKGRELNNLSD
ncbi:MAG: aminotransferase class V-fold PLP-dependent enzyme [Candidatus Hodarchaeota archaeon]